MRLWQPIAGVVAIVVMGVAIFGLGMGDGPKGDPAPTGPALVASRSAIADGNAQVRRGRKEFAQQHCSTCHAIAATHANGVLGPRMDTQDDPVADIAENIAEPRKDIKMGYEAKLMPTDYTERMGSEQIADVAAFIHAASAGTPAEDEEKGGEKK